MSGGQVIQIVDSGNNNPLPSTVPANRSIDNDHVLKNSGWLCGFRVDNIDKPQVLPHRVALYADGETPFIEETNEMRTEVATMDNKRESNYVHHGWSAGAIATVSPWTTSRIHATNRHNSGGAWVTKKILATRLRIQVLPQDLAPVPEFVVAMEEAVSRSTRFERLQAVYHALSRWGDVVPIEIEIGFSLTLTDTEANFKKLPASLSNSLAHLSTIKTASIMRKGAADSMGWNDDAWATKDVPATEWRTTTIVTVVPTICLLPDDLQAQLAHLYAEKLSYVPPLAIEPIIWRRAIYDNTGNASRTISRVGIRIGYRIESISVAYLDGEASRGGVERGAEQTFVLANGDYIIEMLTCADNDGWLCGLQFITNTGRCSAIYGRWEGAPTIARSRGGILAGFSIRTKLDVDDNEEITGVWGIWRHDYISQVPKENDVYSDYFGAEAQSGICFNDRTLIGNSSSMRISSVEIGFGDGIDSIQFTYTDTRNGQNSIRMTRHGGPGGSLHQFELGDEEYIVSVSGRYNEKVLTQLCFGTNLGRISEIYGRGDGKGFSARAPLGENGKHLGLHYVLGKSDDSSLNGIMFVWTPDML